MQLQRPQLELPEADRRLIRASVARLAAAADADAGSARRRGGLGLVGTGPWRCRADRPLDPVAQR